MRLFIYYAAVLSAMSVPLWVPDEDARGWPVTLYIVWLVACWLVFVWNQPRPNHWPKPPCERCGRSHR